MHILFYIYWNKLADLTDQYATTLTLYTQHSKSKKPLFI